MFWGMWWGFGVLFFHYMYHFLVTIFLHTLYSLIYRYMMMMYVFFTFVSHVLFLFSLYTHISPFNTTCLCFTLDALMNLVKVFQIRQVASLSYHDLFSCKVLQELIVVVRLMNFWLFVIVMELLLYTSFIIILVVLSQIAKGGDC